MDDIIAPCSETLGIGSAKGAGEIAYLDFGPKTRPVDLVFLHANGFNAQTYRSILTPLAATFRILAPDLRGHGATTLPAIAARRKGWLDWRDDLNAFLDGLRIGPVALGGHSMGGTISLLAAAGGSGRVRALALFDPVILPPQLEQADPPYETPLARSTAKRRRAFESRTAAFAAYRGRGAFATWPDEMLEDYVSAGFRDQPGGGVELACTPEWEASNYLAQGNNSWGALDASSCPIHVWRAERGSTCHLAPWPEALTARGRIRIETVPGTTHFLPMERPDIVRAGLKAAIAET